MKVIDELKQYVKENANKKIKGMSLHKAYSSFSMLEAVDLMINEYFKEDKKESGAILLDVFGILQGFFVAVDALYDLSLSITKYKYNVNLNLNPVLHELKFVRNDIVGHPTNRTYPNGSIGFSVFNYDKFSKDKLTYKTYYYFKNDLTVKEREIDFKDLAVAYELEKNIILSDLRNYCLASIKDDSYVADIFKLYTKSLKKENINEQEILEIKDKFSAKKGLDNASNHRFLWRLNLLIILLNWQEEDTDLQELIFYMFNNQILKVYKIALEIEHKKGNIPYLPLPNILKQFYRFIRKNEEATYKYLENLNDYNYPYFHEDIDALYAFNPPKKVITLLNWFSKITDANKVYIIGSTLKDYRKK